MMMKLPLSFILKSASTLHFLQKFSSLAPATKTKSHKSNFIANYLITSCGFSPQKAAATSKYFSSRRSFPSKLDSVRHFLKHVGFSDAHIRSIISNFPFIICTDVGRVLQPNLQALGKFGFAEHELRKVIVSNPRVLFPRAIARLEFWKTFLNDDSRKLLAAFTRNRNLVSSDIDKNVVPKVSLLKNYGFSDTDIGWFVVNSPNLMLRSIASIEALLKKAQELGFVLEPVTFRHGFALLSTLGADAFMAKLKLFERFGWSRQEFLTALRMSPCFLHLAENNIEEKMTFLVGTAGCTQSYIASRPMILAYSLEKRLTPRHNVMKILKSKGLTGRDYDFYAISMITEKKFTDRFILRYKDKAPTLLQTYYAACGIETL